MTRNIFFSSMLVSLLLASMFVTGKAEALASCGSTYTVQWGDTLSGIAANCGTTMFALRQANPGVYSWVYAGQVLVMPGYAPAPGSGAFTYVVARGDTLKKIAARYGTTMYAIGTLNGLYNYNLIYVGQVLTIPGSGSSNPGPQVPPAPPYSGSTYVVQRWDTLRILANRWGVSIFDILAANPQITNANLIFAGQVLNIPGTNSGSTNPSYYTVQRGDTLRIIANIYGTTVYNLLLLNPRIWNPNLIYPGMVIRVK